MPSFTMTIKDEICQKDFRDDCQKALIAAIIKLIGVVSTAKKTIKIKSFHKKTINLVFKLLKKQYSSINLELLVDKNKKKILYTLVINSRVDEIIDEFYLLIENNLYFTKTKLKNHCLRAYIAGVFLVSGSINSPKTSNYHLELQFNNSQTAHIIQTFLLKRFKFHFKVITRRKKNVLYLKKSNDISDFLKVLDCPQAVFSFEDKRITRELLNTINRFNNIDISNQQKIIITGAQQVEMINEIVKKGSFNELSIKCQTLSNLRLKHPEASLTELCDFYYKSTGEVISKSGVNHLMRELKKKFQELL